MITYYVLLTLLYPTFTYRNEIHDSDSSRFGKENRPGWPVARHEILGLLEFHYAYYLLLTLLYLTLPYSL